MKVLLPRLFAVTFAAACLLLASCASTKIESNYVAPGLEALKFKKVYLIGLVSDSVTRAKAESTMKDWFLLTPAVTSSDLLPNDVDLKNKDKVIQSVKESQCDGVLVARLLYKGTNVTFSGGQNMNMGYEHFTSYYADVSATVPFYQNSANVYANIVVGVELSIFEVGTGKLLWKVTTKTRKKASDFVDASVILNEVLMAAREKLVAQKLIK